MDNSTLLLIAAVVFIIIVLSNKKAEHASLADRLGTQDANIGFALRQKLASGETPAQQERLGDPYGDIRGMVHTRGYEQSTYENFGDPYEDVQKALAARRFERMCSSKNNHDDPLNEALHGGSALSAM
jgi:hypothetical protein